jgi:hypothetical protein
MGAMGAMGAIPGYAECGDGSHHRYNRIIAPIAKSAFAATSKVME